MNWLRNWKVGPRLAGALAAVGLLLLSIVAVAWWQMSVMQASSRMTSTHWLPSVDQVNRLNMAAANIRIQEYARLVNTDFQARAAVDTQIDKLKGQFDGYRNAYRALLGSDAERERYETFEAQWKQYVAVGDQVHEHSRKYETDQANSLMVGEARSRFLAAAATLDQLVELNLKGANAETARSDQAFTNARTAMLACAAAGVVLLVVLSVLLQRSITVPLAEAVRVTQAVAAGDLGSRIVVSSRDETGQVLGGLKAMNESLVRIVGLVRNSSDSIATGSAEIASGNADLSQRTEQQASALEQTAATMEQLGSTVRHNADNARQADALAKGASEVAERGGRVVSQVVDTMKSINDASKRIADITAVIDGIAFQTNILALNAAVEAARAGEQGRGFAVVAGEVRSLAQRSAEAAKEIKGLIGASVERVGQGTALADVAGSTMTEIVLAIKRVTDIVAEIASASVEQSSGVSQVGEAVAQMDHVTQQNAALVEQSAAAAESLKQQAQALVQAVAVFRL